MVLINYSNNVFPRHNNVKLERIDSVMCDHLTWCALSNFLP